MLLDSIV